MAPRSLLDGELCCLSAVLNSVDMPLSDSEEKLICVHLACETPTVPKLEHKVA